MKKILLMMIAAIAVIACESEPVIPELNILSQESDLVIPSEGGDVTVNFETNVAWTVALKESASWCTVTPASGDATAANFKVIAVENSDTDNRTVTLVITADTEVKEVTVTQLQKDALTLSGEKTFEVPFTGGEVKFSVAHNVELTVTPSESWIVATKAMETTEYTFTVEANTGAARTGKITVTNGTLKEEITVNQEAFVPEFEVSPAADQWLAMEGGSASIEVKANVEYTVTVAENTWLTTANEGNKYTFTAAENTAYDYRSVAVTVAPKDEAYADKAVTFYVFQNGHASKAWSKNPASDFEGYDASQKARLAKYGDYILLANGSKVFALDPATGDLKSTISVPEGYSAQSLVVDDAGNLLIAADAAANTDMTIYYVADPFNPAPEAIITWNTGNYYGSLETGNIRVKGNIKENAVITATVAGSVKEDGSLDPKSGAVVYWEVVAGTISDWKWTNAPYTAWNVTGLCAAPAGTSAADGFFYIGYGGDYNLKYAATIANGAGTDWAISYTTGSSWMENYNCISTAEWKGTKYAAIVMGCHFNYDAADALLLKVDSPATAELLYRHYGDGDAAWDWGAGVNNSWTGKGAYSDVLLVPSDNSLLMIYIDSNYGAMACVEIK